MRVTRASAALRAVVPAFANFSRSRRAYPTRRRTCYNRDSPRIFARISDWSERIARSQIGTVGVEKAPPQPAVEKPRQDACQNRAQGHVRRRPRRRRALGENGGGRAGQGGVQRGAPPQQRRPAQVAPDETAVQSAGRRRLARRRRRRQSIIPRKPRASALGITKTR